jgi:hypothetical protein
MKEIIIIIIQPTNQQQQQQKQQQQHYYSRCHHHTVVTKYKVSIIQHNLHYHNNKMHRVQSLLLSIFLTLGAEAFSPLNLRTATSSRNAANTLQSSSKLNALLSLELEKPLGIILEEMEEGGSEGVRVEELADSGSAYSSEYRDTLVGLKIAQVMDSDVTSK